MPRSYEKQKICYMFSVLNEYNLLWKASYQERKRLGYFEKTKVYPRNTQHMLTHAQSVT